MEERTSVQVHHMTKGDAISEPTRRSNLLQDARIRRANETLLSGRYSRWEFLSEMGHATGTRFCENISFIQGAQRADWVVDGDNLNPTPENQGLYLDVAGEEMPLVGNLDPHLNVAGEETSPVGNLEQPINVHEEGGANQTKDWRNVKVYTLSGESIEIQDLELENTVVTEETEEAQSDRELCRLCLLYRFSRVITPCNHVICGYCTKDLKNENNRRIDFSEIRQPRICPLCRAVIGSFFRMYIC